MNSGADLVLIALSGALGSAHCIGMCGGLAIAMNRPEQRARVILLRQLVWSAGRVSTYGFLGVSAATLGGRLLQTQRLAGHLQVLLAVVAGVLLMAQGLHAAGWLRWRVRRRSGLPCVAVSVFREFLSGRSMVGVFVAGLATGFLPCGLVYSFLALAASSAMPGTGLLIMVCFGLGTLPVMILTGTSLSIVTLTLRRRLFRLAAICLLLTGVLTTARGVAFAWSDSERPQDACPFCTSNPAEPPAAGVSDAGQGRAASHRE